MAKRFCVARHERGYIVTYGVGPTPALAEISCRNHAINEKKADKIVSYEPYVMPKSRFKVGQRIRQADLPSITYKVLAVPDNPLLVGSIVTHTILGGCRVWESESKFEAIP